ncbi:hypothetical protein ABH14_18455 [Brevibacillus brevis]|uniref:tetratricopeptide repeat protein n=1 Tax=Brevibacillus brevis TaxID=1393 RepID=UPI001901B758|nr:tetratricopeptide repeat protein [Brevibacillus brevis]MBH0331723.1 hypothetical protein [Brevibacillus brevis]
MKQSMTHQWLIGSRRSDREKKYFEEQYSTCYVSNCHCNLRGPYTGTGDLLRQIIPEAYSKWPDLILSHCIEILSIAPELKAVIPVSVETLTSLAIPKERTRYYSKLRTLRMSNGLIDLLLALANRERMGKLTLVFENVQACDQLDAEFISTLLRRAKSDLIQVIVSSSEIAETEALKKALQKYTEPTTILSDIEQDRGIVNLSDEQRLELTKRYIFSDCTSDCEQELLAYEATPIEIRQSLHEERAESLRKEEQWSLHLGAIPFHLERGTSEKSASEALFKAVSYSINMGFYDATIDMSLRGRKLTNWSSEFDNSRYFTMKMATSLAALGETDDIPTLLGEVYANTDDFRVHMQISYGFSMYYTRHHREREHEKAREWIQKAIDLAEWIEDEKERAFQQVFNQNGLALVELHMDNPEEALRLVTEGWQRLNQTLAPDEHMLHRSVLLHNKGLIYVALKRFEEAAETFSQVIQIDSNYPEYYFDRGNLYSRMGRMDEAIEDYNQAIKLSPPFPEVYFNRATAFNRLGDVEKAMADYDYLLDIEPENLDGLLNRATLLYQMEKFEMARKDAEFGLEIEPDHARLLCTLGLIEMSDGNNDQALKTFTAALNKDREMMAAWTNRAVLYYEMGEYDRAIADLTEAIALEKNATVLYNRAWVYEAQEEWQLSISDYTEALAFSDADEQDIYYRRGLCFIKMGDRELGTEDWNKHLMFGESPHVDEMMQLLPSLFVSK